MRLKVANPSLRLVKGDLDLAVGREIVLLVYSEDLALVALHVEPALVPRHVHELHAFTHPDAIADRNRRRLVVVAAAAEDVEQSAARRGRANKWRPRGERPRCRDDEDVL